MLAAVESLSLSKVRKAKFNTDIEYELYDVGLTLESLSPTTRERTNKIAAIVGYFLSPESNLDAYGQLIIVGQPFIMDVVDKGLITISTLEDLLQRSFLEASDNLTQFALYIDEILKFIEIFLRASGRRRLRPHFVFRVANLKYLIDIGHMPAIREAFRALDRARKRYYCFEKVTRFVHAAACKLLLDCQETRRTTSILAEEIEYTEHDTTQSFYWRAVSYCQSREELTEIIEQAKSIKMELINLPEIRVEKWARDLTFVILSNDLKPLYQKLCDLSCVQLLD